MFESRRVQEASKPVALYEFLDSHFSRCKEIRETNCTIDEYEAIANNLLTMLASDDNQVFSEGARGIAALAYNTFMDPDDRWKANPEPFFHKYNETEQWLQYNAHDLNDEFDTARQVEGHSLRLVKPDASEFERKSSIGVWAFLHLRAFGEISCRALQNTFMQFYERKGGDLMQRWYGFESSYEIRALNENVYSSLIDEYKNRRNTEILYLFFRAAIILEQNYKKRTFGNKKKLLMQLAFGGYHGLRYGGLWLCHDFHNASKKLLALDIFELCDCIDRALVDLNCSEDLDRARAVLKIFRKFYEEYVNPGLDALRTMRVVWRRRYYMYAHVVNNDYFYWIGSRDILELSHALHLISGMPNMRLPPSPYKERGEAIAARIRAKDNEKFDRFQLES